MDIETARQQYITMKTVGTPASEEASGDGVAVEVVVPGAAADVRRKVGDSLEQWGVPLRELHIRDRRDALARPYPLRCDGR